MTGCWSRAASLQLRTTRLPSRHCSACRQRSMLWHSEGVPLPCSPPQCLPACHCCGWDGAVSFAVPAMALCPGSVSAPCRPPGCCAEHSAAELCFPALCSPALSWEFQRSQKSPVPRSLRCSLARASVCTDVCRTTHRRAKTSLHTHLCIHTCVCTPLHSPMCALHPWASKSVQNQKALCKDLDAHTCVHAHTHMHAPHPFAQPRAQRHERSSSLAHSHVHAHTCKTFTCKHRARSHAQCTL